MTLKEQEVREAMYRAALKQMAIDRCLDWDNAKHLPNDVPSSIWKPGSEPNYATVKADLK